MSTKRYMLIADSTMDNQPVAYRFVDVADKEELADAIQAMVNDYKDEAEWIVYQDTANTGDIRPDHGMDRVKLTDFYYEEDIDEEGEDCGIYHWHDEPYEQFTAIEW